MAPFGPEIEIALPALSACGCVGSFTEGEPPLKGNTRHPPADGVCDGPSELANWPSVYMPKAAAPLSTVEDDEAVRASLIVAIRALSPADCSFCTCASVNPWLSEQAAPDGATARLAKLLVTFFTTTDTGT